MDKAQKHHIFSLSCSLSYFLRLSGRYFSLAAHTQATGLLATTNHKGGKVTFIEEIYVSKQARRDQHVSPKPHMGASMLQAIAERESLTLYFHLITNASPHSPQSGAHSFFTSLGFREVPERDRLFTDSHMLDAGEVYMGINRPTLLNKLTVIFL